MWTVDARNCNVCGNFHAYLMPWLDTNGQMILSLSNGAPFKVWQANAQLYRPTFRNLPLPTFRTDAPVSGAGMVPRDPVRAIDTRQTHQRVRGGSFLTVPLTNFVAADAVGVVANLTAVNPAAAGFLTAWPCGAAMPTTSVLNYRGARNTANGVHVRLGPAKQLCVYSQSDTDILVDVTGSYVPAGSGLHTLTAARVADTQPSAPLAAGATLTVPVAGLAGVPATGVAAVTVTVTAIAPAGSGYATVWPCSQQMPTVSTLNFVQGDTIANSATLPLGAAGDLCVFSPTATHLTVDVDGWWDGSGMRARIGQPTRLLDTRAGAKPLAGATVNTALTSLPADTKAVVANIAAVAPAAAGNLTAWACDVQPAGSTVAYASAENRAGMTISALSATRQLCLTTTKSSHLLIDVMVTFS